jgi:hypothetical protein
VNKSTAETSKNSKDFKIQRNIKNHKNIRWKGLNYYFPGISLNGPPKGFFEPYQNFQLNFKVENVNDLRGTL